MRLVKQALYIFFALLPLLVYADSLVDAQGNPSPALRQLFYVLENIDPQIPLSFAELTAIAEEKWLQTGKERWEFEHRYRDKAQYAIYPIRALELTEEKKAQKLQYDYAIVLGATTSTMKNRLAFLVEEYLRGVRFKKLIFLTGQRQLTNFESTVEGIETEAQMMRYLFQKIDCDPLKTVPMRFINAPNKLTEDGKIERPSRRDTIQIWLESSPKPGSCLFISNMPFCRYEHAALRNLMPKGFTIETIGPKAREDLRFEVQIDNIARWMKLEKAYLDTQRSNQSAAGVDMAM